MKARKPIKVCHLTSVHPVFDTRIFFKECRSLAKEYDVFLIAPHFRNENVEGVQIIRIRKYRRRLLRFAFTDTELHLKALAVNAKVYHLHDPELIPFGLLLRILGKKVIYDIHEDVVADISEKKWLPGKTLASAVYSVFERLASRSLSLVLANDTYIEKYRKISNSFCLVRNYPLHSLLEKYSVTEPGNKLLLVGNLSAKRGLGAILTAMVALKRNGVEVPLAAVGTYSKEVKEILSDIEGINEIHHLLEFTGYLTYDTAYRYRKQSFAGLCLLEDVPNNRNIFPTKLFEYITVGLPVIVTDFPNLSKFVDQYQCGVTANPNNTDSIVQAVLTLYQNRDLTRKLSVNALQASQNFDWVTEEKTLMDFYQRLES